MLRVGLRANSGTLPAPLSGPLGAVGKPGFSQRILPAYAAAAVTLGLLGYLVARALRYLDPFYKMNHTIDVQRPEPRWTPLQLISPAGRPEPELLQHIACLKQEIADLRDYSERVTIELRTLRLKHAISPSSLDTTEDFDKLGKTNVTPEGETPQAAAKGGTEEALGRKAISEMPLPAWALNMQLMCPLLSAYDDRIKEQQGLLDRREGDIQRMAESIMELTKENESLAQEVHTKTGQLKALVAGDTQAEESGCTMRSVVAEKNELLELYNLTKEQNEVLTDQNHLMKCHIENVEKQVTLLRAQLQEAEEQQVLITDMRTKTESLQRLLRDTNQTLEATARDRDALKQRAQQLESDLAVSESLCKEVKGKSAAQEEQMEEERRTAREVARRLETFEGEKQAQFQALENELAELQKNYSQLSWQNGKIEQDTEKAREIITYLETKSSSYEKENSELKQKLSELDQKVQEVTLEKEKLVASTSVMQAQLEKMREQYSEQTMVERNLIDEQFQSAKRQLQQQVDELRRESRELTAVNAELSLAADSAERRRKVAAAEAAQAQEELQAAVRAHQAIAEQLQQAKAEAERERDTLKEQLDSLAVTTAERVAARDLDVQKFQTEASHASNLLAAEEQRRREAEMHAEALKSEICQLSRKHSCLEKELNTVKKAHEEQREELRNKHAEVVSQLEMKLRDVVQESQLKKQQAVNLVKEEEELRQRLTQEYKIERKTAEAKLEKLRASNTMLRSKLLELVRCIDHTSSKERLEISTSVDSNEVSLGFPSRRSTCTHSGQL